jgi:uncharacterized protein (TIRG00374 family)
MRNVVKPALLLALSAAILAAVARAVGVEETLEAVRQAGFAAFVVAAALTPLILLLLTSAWAALTRAVHRGVRFRSLFEGMVVGMAGNMLTPSTYLGGEPLKVIYVGKATGNPYHQVAGTVLLSKYLEALSFILLLGFSAAVATASYRGVLFAGPYLPAGVTLLLLAGALLGVAAALWLALSRRWHPVTRLVRGLARVPLLSRIFTPLGDRAKAMEDQVGRVFCEERRAARLAFGSFLLAHGTMFVKPGIFFLLGSRIGVGLPELCLIFVAQQALLAVQLTPGGVGILDGGLIGMFALMGLDEAQAAAYLLCVRFTDALIVGAGALLAARMGVQVIGKRHQRSDEAAGGLEAEADAAAA